MSLLKMASATAQTVALFRLTDEELHLLGAADDVDTPYLDRLEPDQRGVAVDVAYRSLLAHGVCEAQDGGLLVPDELVQLLQVRAGPERAYRIEVRSQGGRSIRHLYEAGGTTVCEDISADGVHDFDVRPVSDSQLLLTEKLGPSANGVVLRAAWRATGDRDLQGSPPPWGAVSATADLTVRTPGAPGDLVSVIWGDAGTYLISEVPVSPSEDGSSWTVASLVAGYLGIERAS